MFNYVLFINVCNKNFKNFVDRIMIFKNRKLKRFDIFDFNVLFYDICDYNRKKLIKMFNYI